MLLPIDEIQGIYRKRIKLAQLTWSKEDIVDHLLKYASDDLRFDLNKALTGKVNALLPRTVVDGNAVPRNSNRYLEIPNDDGIRECYSRFYDATSNAAVIAVTCAACSHEVNMKDDEVRTMLLSQLPNVHCLIPHSPHLAHELVNGLLLEQDCFVSVVGRNESTCIYMCKSCFTDLSGSSNDIPPMLSLANNMWIGRVPWQLEILTLPKSLLIAHLFPHVYVIKMYPKAYRGSADPSYLQHGLRGNVSTYELNVPDVASMVQGKLMPQFVDILPKIVVLSYIGKGHLPKNFLHSTFRVHRQAVMDALWWLKEHNPKYYGHIEISRERLDSLPDDDIPVTSSSIY